MMKHRMGQPARKIPQPEFPDQENDNRPGKIRPCQAGWKARQQQGRVTFNSWTFDVGGGGANFKGPRLA